MISKDRTVRLLAVTALAVSIQTNAGIPVETVDVGNLRVEHHGTRGSPIILIPGLACGSWVSKKLSRAVSEAVPQTPGVIFSLFFVSAAKSCQVECVRGFMGNAVIWIRLV